MSTLRNGGLQSHAHPVARNARTCSPLNLYPTSRIIAYRTRAKDSGVDRLIEKACTRIKSSLGKPQVCTATAVVGHPRPVQGGWAEEWIGPRRDRDPPPPRQEKREIGRALRARWKDRWPRSAAEAVTPQWKSARPAPRAAQSRKPLSYSQGR
jgi:hypothetical protein